MNPILKRVITGLTVAAIVIAAILLAPVTLFKVICAILGLLAFGEYTTLLKRKVALSSFWGLLGMVIGAVILGAAFSVLAMIVGAFDDGNIHGNLMLLYVIAIVKFSDTGGFALGLTSAKLMKGGNHKMCPSISPNKSWEGLAGSIMFSVIVSLCFSAVTHFTPLHSMMLGVMAAILGTAGDLVESKFKRWVGVKDSSAWAITNGMGGFLDMFDSILFAPAVLFCFMR